MVPVSAFTMTATNETMSAAMDQKKIGKQSGSSATAKTTKIARKYRMVVVFIFGK